MCLVSLQWELMFEIVSGNSSLGFILLICTFPKATFHVIKSIILTLQQF